MAAGSSNGKQRQEEETGGLALHDSSAEEEENFVYPYNAFEVDSSKKTEFDAQSLESSAINLKIRELMKEGFGHKRSFYKRS